MTGSGSDVGARFLLAAARLQCIGHALSQARSIFNRVGCPHAQGAAVFNRVLA